MQGLTMPIAPARGFFLVFLIGLPLLGEGLLLAPTEPRKNPAAELTANKENISQGNFSHGNFSRANFSKDNFSRDDGNASHHRKQHEQDGKHLAADAELGGYGATNNAGNGKNLSGFLRSDNGTVLRFSSCDLACDKCFDEHYQGCLAFCQVGCEDYCAQKLPRPECEISQAWVARVAHVLQALDIRARMCQATGINGCPSQPTLAPTHVPFDSYNAERGKKGSAVLKSDQESEEEVTTTDLPGF